MCILCQLISFRKGLRYLLCHFDVEKRPEHCSCIAHSLQKSQKHVFQSEIDLSA